MNNFEKHQSITIEDDTSPDILVNGEKYTLLCEFETINRNFTHVYVEENGTDVVVQLSPQSAVVGLFSVEAGRIDDLFRYIEASIASKDGFVCYSSDDLLKYFDMVPNKALKYPIILND